MNLIFLLTIVLNNIIIKSKILTYVGNISYEIYCSQTYVDNLKAELDRFDQIHKYKSKMEKAKKEKDKQYYQEGIKMLLVGYETLENYEDIYQQYVKAYEQRKKAIDNLYDEIKKIKKLKV